MRTHPVISELGPASSEGRCDRVPDRGLLSRALTGLARVHGVRSYRTQCMRLTPFAGRQVLILTADNLDSC